MERSSLNVLLKNIATLRRSRLASVKTNKVYTKTRSVMYLVGAWHCLTSDRLEAVKYDLASESYRPRATA